MKFAVDLHIHSALSPCSDNDMTPNNIVSMAFLKELDFIAVTDHNSIENINAVLKCAEQMGIIAVPGMELETCEEVHLICLFPTIEKALEFQKVVYAHLPRFENREDIFGEQLVMDDSDNITGRMEWLLLTAAQLSIEDAFAAVEELGGAIIPAHVDRDSYSIISNLGGIPENLKAGYVEISKNCDLTDFMNKNDTIRPFSFIRSSDAHHLGDILERESFIELEEKSVDCLIKILRNGR